MTALTLCEHTRQLPESVAPAGKSTDETVRYLPETEYLRRFARYRHTDVLLARKYGMSFDEFVRNMVTRTS